MAPVAGRPFLSFVIEHLLQQGIDRFIFSLGFMHQVIGQYVNDQYAGLPVKYSVEHEPLGTGGAIRMACRKATEKTVLVVNGDTLFKINTGNLAAFHESRIADCTICLKPMVNFSRYGVVELNEDHSVKSFHEKQNYESGYINGGVYALQAAHFLQEDLPTQFSFETDYLEKFYLQRPLYGVVQDEYFIDIGIPEDYQRAKEELVPDHQ